MTAASTGGVQLRELETGIWLLELDMPGKSANVLTAPLQAALEDALEQLEHHANFMGLVVISAKPEIFVAGADLVAIQQTLHWSTEEIEQFCFRGQQLFARLAGLPGPVVAAIHGVCVGGGLELALACDYRLGTPDRKTLLGLPEVKLGLIPGWGGTVRLPRIAGLALAAEWTCGGELYSSETAARAGILDALVARDQLLATAVSWARERQGEYRQRREELKGPVRVVPADLPEFAAEQLKKIESARLDPTAPRVAWDQLRSTCDADQATALRGEAAAMARVYGSETNAALLNAFFLGEYAKKLTRAAAAVEPTIHAVGIVGAGLMGSEIAAMVGDQGGLVLFDSQPERSQALAAQLQGSTRKTSASVAETMVDLASCDLIIEAIPEKLELKREVFTQLETALPTDAVLATNTSVLSLTELAAGLHHPARMCGMHFCYPVSKRSAVELIAGPATAAATMERAAAWLATRRRIPVRVADHPGFVVNRVLCPMLNEANHLLCQGLAAEEIDAAMRGAGFEFGPLEFVDQIGIDVSYHAALALFPRLPTPLEPCLVLHGLYRAGLRGRKSGSGYYTYPADGRRCGLSETAARVIQGYARQCLELTAAEIVHRLLAVMANQALDVLYARTVGSARDVDLLMIQGGGVPERIGGILQWAGRRGGPELLREFEVLERDTAHRGRFRPTAGLQAWASGAWRLPD